MKQFTYSYQNLGEKYAKKRKGTPEFAKFMIEQSKILKSQHNNIIFELGAGSGQQTFYVRNELIKNKIAFELFAYDKSYNLITKTDQLNILSNKIKEKQINNIFPIKYNFDGKPLLSPKPLQREIGTVYTDIKSFELIPNNSVSLVFMAFVHHHLKKKQAVLNEIFRVLKKNGTFFIFGASYEDVFKHPLYKYFPKLKEVDRKRYITRKEVENLFKKAGFLYKKEQSILREKNKVIDSLYLESVKSTIINSGLKVIEKKYPKDFRKGIIKLEREINELAPNYKSFNMFRTVFWGTK